MGDTAETAIGKMYAVYGSQTSVTNTMNALKRDKRMGLSVPSLELSSCLAL
jgi:hypothetical protein